MPTTDDRPAAADIRRKLRALAAVVRDRATTEHEKANAQAIKQRLEQTLTPDPPNPSPPDIRSRTDVMYRLGRGVKALTTPSSPNRDWTDHAYRFGRMFRRLVKQ
jgi:hypothetical protein